MSVQLAILVGLSAASPGLDTPQSPASPAAISSESAGSRLRTLHEAEWAWRASELGIPDDDLTSRADYLPRVDAATQRRRFDYWTKALASLRQIPLDQLSADDRITAEVFRTVLEAFVAQQTYRDFEAPFASGNSFCASLAPRGGFGTPAEYRAYLGRMRLIPRYFDEQTENMRAGLKRGFTPPRVSIEGREASITPYMNADPEKNPFFIPFRQMPPSVSEAEAEALRTEAREVIAKAVAPAYAKLLPFIRDQYIPGARTTLAAEKLPNGPSYYRAKVREFTTLGLTPAEIHAIGLKEVARINADMQATMKASGWTGDFAGFLKFLKTDPQFYAKTPYELIAKST